MTAITGTYTINKSLILKYLARRLKEAGFPQEGYGSFAMEGERLYFPTLSELIEACGGGLQNLTNFGDLWQTNCKEGMTGITAGITPEEAVASLWLRLNKNKTTK